MNVSDLLRGKLFGHPIHVMLIHFPAALLPTAAVLDILNKFGIIHAADSISFLLWPGVSLGWLAVTFGIWDLIRLPLASPEMSRALIHGGINTSALLGFTWVLLSSFISTSGNPLSAHPDSTILRLWVELFCMLLILVGNKFGGDLIFRYSIGHISHTPE